MSSRKSARTKSKASSAEKELRASLSSLKVELSRSEKQLTKVTDRGDRWKTEAKTLRKAASLAEARAAKLQRKLDRATADRAPAPSDDAQPEAVPAGVEPAPAAVSQAVPDQTWSVVQLRAEARTRGLVGLSNKSKADLIAALS